MYKHKFNKFFAVLIFPVMLLIFYGCSEDDNPADSNTGNTAKIEGRVTGSSGFSKINSLNKTSGIEGAAVTVAKVQANGSLSTVSKSQRYNKRRGQIYC